MCIAAARGAERVGEGLERDEVVCGGKERDKMAQPLCVQSVGLEERPRGGVSREEGTDESGHQFGELRGGEAGGLLVLGQFAKLR